MFTSSSPTQAENTSRPSARSVSDQGAVAAVGSRSESASPTEFSSSSPPPSKNQKPDDGHNGYHPENEAHEAPEVNNRLCYCHSRPLATVPVENPVRTGPGVLEVQMIADWKGPEIKALVKNAIRIVPVRSTSNLVGVIGTARAPGDSRDKHVAGPRDVICPCRPSVPTSLPREVQVVEAWIDVPTAFVLTWITAGCLGHRRSLADLNSVAAGRR